MPDTDVAAAEKASIFRQFAALGIACAAEQREIEKLLRYAKTLWWTGVDHRELSLLRLDAVTLAAAAEQLSRDINRTIWELA